MKINNWKVIKWMGFESHIRTSYGRNENDTAAKENRLAVPQKVNTELPISPHSSPKHTHVRIGNICPLTNLYANVP